MIIFNEGNPGRTDNFGGTLGGEVGIPVLSASHALGVALSTGGPTVHIKTDTTVETKNTSNLVAETAAGRSDRVVVVGAHLDSVPGGAGIQDNGSGSAAILEIALQMKKLNIKPVNKVRFMWFGAEEAGLLGSENYVASLTARQKKDIALNLNFDMIASPNYVRFVYDGDGSDTADAGPNGSATIEDVFAKYFAKAKACPLKRPPLMAAQIMVRSLMRASRPAACSLVPKSSKPQRKRQSMVARLAQHLILAIIRPAIILPTTILRHLTK